MHFIHPFTTSLMEGVQHLKIPLENIKLATKNFSDETFIAQGGFGKVYVGILTLSEQQIKVAVKRRLDSQFGQGLREYLMEIQMLTRYRHKNLVSLVGFCDENGENILVYEYVKHGSLDRYLSNSELSWIQRLKISLGVARGLNYLHDEVGPQHRVLHRDIKSPKILLDENWEAKVSDFGLSKIDPSNLKDTYLITAPCGTIGYIDPEYLKTGILTRESDVYSFGVLLFEILCGRPALVHRSQDGGGFLATLAKQSCEQKRLDEIIIPDLKNQMREDSLNVFSTAAYQCLKDNRSDRPTMRWIVEKLEYALRLQTNFHGFIESNESMMRMLEKKTNFHGFIESNESMMRMPEKKGLLGAVSKATNHYHDRNIIKDGGSGKVYKGKLLWNGRLMYFAVWRLNRMYRENYIDFRRELEFLSAIKHDNISSIFAYFDEDKDDENIIIYNHAFHGNLQGHLRNPALTWSRRLQICFGVARALDYIHNKGLIHCDINSSKILLDEDWEPKIFGFELCTQYFQSWTHRLHLSRYLDTTSVMTPTYDVYLFGVLLFEVLCGKKPMLDEDGFNGKLDDIIDPSLRIQIESRSMKLFIKIAYSCLDKKLVERPSMKEIVEELEEALELQPEQENLERSTNREGALWKSPLVEILEIPLIEIIAATNNFDEAFLVGSGGFNTMYRAELDVLDIQSVSSIEGKSKKELPRIRKTVAIKRLLKKRDKQAEEGFLAEIELLSSCKHQHVVSLLGFSREANEMILVCEYALNGSLSDYLGSELRLTWPQRIQICLQVADGIKYLHTTMEGKPMIIHRDIKSENILLDGNLNAKVADFGLSRFHHTLGQKSTILTKIIAGTEVYIDPEYRTSGKYKKESDIYSFGVVLFEVLSGKMAYDSTYMREYDDGLAPVVRRRFDDRTLMELIDPKMLEDDEHTFTLNRGPTQDSFNLFSKVGYECLAKTQAERPKMEVVIKTLQDALEAQGGTMVLSRFRLSSIELATQNFDNTYYMELDTYGKVYKAQLDHFESNSLLATEGKKNGEPSKKRISVVIKRISGRKDEYGEKGFFSEIEMHTRYKHPNIVPALLGFCYEGDNMLLVYEHASNESLDNYLRDTDNMTKYTWIHRLHHCLGIAHGLNHLHTLMDHKQEMINVDIRSANILLGKSGEAKIAYFGFSKLLPTNEEASTNAICTKVYCYPEYRMTRKQKKQSDIYSFGVVLFEIFCGRLAYDPVYILKNDYGLAPIARQCFSDGIIMEKIMEMIDPALKEETLEDVSTSNREPILDSLGTYLRIANQCLAENRAERPTVQTVIKELEIALNIQKLNMGGGRVVEALMQ